MAETGAIIDHPDVRRMLMEMKARTEAARAICYDTAKALDMARAAPEGARAAWAARGAFLTPLAKAYGTYTGMQVADDAEQEVRSLDSPMTRNLAAVHEAAEDVTQWMLAQNDMVERLAGSHAYLMLMATLHGGTLLHRGLRAAQARMADDPDFYLAKIAIASYYLAHIAPEAMGYARSARLGSSLHYALTPQQLMAS